MFGMIYSFDYNLYVDTNGYWAEKSHMSPKKTTLTVADGNPARHRKWEMRNK